MEEYVDESVMKNLISAVLKQAILDWRALGEGEYSSARSAGVLVYRKELLRFFWSKEFEAFCKFVLPVKMEDIFETLHIPTQEEAEKCLII